MIFYILYIHNKQFCLLSDDKEGEGGWRDKHQSSAANGTPKSFNGSLGKKLTIITP